MATLDELYDQAVEKLRKGDAPGAEKRLLKLLKKSPDTVPALHMLGTLHAQAGRLDQAVKYLKKALVGAPDHFGTLVNLGNVLLSRQSYAEAEECYRKAIELAPDASVAHGNLGAALKGLGRLEEAEVSCRKALDIDAANGDAATNLGAILKGLGRADEAKEACLKALQVNPNAIGAHHNLGNLYAEAGQYDEAITCYRKVLALHPGHAEACRYLGDALYNSNRFDDAAHAYGQALQLDPAGFDAHINYGLCLARCGDDKRTRLLATLKEDHLYKTPDEAAQIAVELARTVPYPFARERELLIEVVEGFDPSRAYSESWWKDTLKQFGPARYGHDKLLRSVFSQVFSWSIPTAEALAAVTDFAGDRPIGSYGAGNGYWEYLLATVSGMTVSASDLYLTHRFMEMGSADWATVELDPNEVVFFSWVPEDEDAVTAATHLLGRLAPGQGLVLVGDRPDKTGKPRTCGGPAFFAFLADTFELVRHVPLVNFSHVFDGVDLYRRC